MTTDSPHQDSIDRSTIFEAWQSAKATEEKLREILGMSPAPDKMQILKWEVKELFFKYLEEPSFQRDRVVLVNSARDALVSEYKKSPEYANVPDEELKDLVYNAASSALGQLDTLVEAEWGRYYVQDQARNRHSMIFKPRPSIPNQTDTSPNDTDTPNTTH